MILTTVSERLKIRVVPNAPKSQCVGEYADAVKIKIAAQATDGKANAELVKYLSKTLGIGRNGVRIITGETARDKLVEVDAQNAKITILNSVK